jgi:DNA-binding winged helix-turn-helix (wHTH) protein/Tfp pilus assembly protein PilF
VSSRVVYGFGPFELDAAARELRRGSAVIPVSDRHLDVLIHLASHPGDVVSKDTLVQAGWGDVAVTDNSLEQAVSALRRALTDERTSYIETVPRRGYRFNAAVTRLAARESDAALDALLAPHRAWLEGRAALLTLERDQIARAREVFEQALRSMPEQPLAHVGLANACAMQFEGTRADASPDVASLEKAAVHAREACRLDPQSGEAWATLGFVLDRAGARDDAVPALRRAIALEPDNWRHQLRLSYASWGEERLRAARRTLALLPDFPLAHWMAATVHIARSALDQAQADLEAGILAQNRQGDRAPFSAPGLHWLLGLIHLARGEDERALDQFEREVFHGRTRHLYGRECQANTWYAIGALRRRQQRYDDAREAFGRAVECLPSHRMARIVAAALGERDGEDGRHAEGGPEGPPLRIDGSSHPVDAAMCRAARAVIDGDRHEAARLVDEALAAAPPGGSGWLLPIEPVLHVAGAPDVWAAALGRLRARAA